MTLVLGAEAFLPSVLETFLGYLRVSREYIALHHVESVELSELLKIFKPEKILVSSDYVRNRDKHEIELMKRYETLVCHGNNGQIRFWTDLKKER